VFWVCLSGVRLYTVGWRCGVCGGLAERDGDNYVCVTAVTITSQSVNVPRLGLERRLVAWCLSCLMTLSSSVSFFSSSFLALSFSHTSRSSSPLLPNPLNVALLLLEVGFQRLLKVGMKSVELVSKQLLLKTGR
jgi:hypothetical protein